MNFTKSNKELANFVLKPEWFANKEAILNKMKDDNINFSRIQKEQFSEQLIEILYGENLEPDFLAEMKKYLIGKDTLIWAILDTDAHQKLHWSTWKNTHAKDCDPWTIRAKYTKEIKSWDHIIVDNAIHRSKDKEQAYRDLTRMNSKIFDLNHDLSLILAHSNPFQSFRNTINIDSEWNIKKTFQEKGYFERELSTIHFLQEQGLDFVPYLKSIDYVNNSLIFPFLGRKLNSSGLPSEILKDQNVGYSLAQCLGRIHKINSSIQSTNIEPIIVEECLKKYWLQECWITYWWVDIVGLKHWDFSLNNVIKWKKCQLYIIDRELSWYGSQKLDIIKLFRTVMRNPILVENMIKIYNNEVWNTVLNYNTLIQLFIDQAIENLITQDASWPKLTDNEQKKYREKLNINCKENLISLTQQNRLKHVEF